MEAQHSEKMTPRDANYYRILDVPFDADLEFIKRRYHAIVRTLHPDRRRPGGTGEALERFHQVQNAWSCLSDTSRRFFYDMRNFGASSLQGEVQHGSQWKEQLIALQKDQATTDIRNMEYTLQKSLRRENKSPAGLLIRQALYGHLQLKPENLSGALSGATTITPDDLVGPTCDVMVPVQCLVEQHSVVLPGGPGTSKSDLPGFYNPAPMDVDVELSLYVCYEFRGTLHEVTISDRETLRLPLRAHVVPPGSKLRGPFSASNMTLLRPAQTGRDRSSQDSQRASNKIFHDSVDAYRNYMCCTHDSTFPSARDLLMYGAMLCFGLTAYQLVG